MKLFSVVSRCVSETWNVDFLMKGEGRGLGRNFYLLVNPIAASFSHIPKIMGNRCMEPISCLGDAGKTAYFPRSIVGMNCPQGNM